MSNDPLSPSAGMTHTGEPSRDIVDALRDTKLRTHSYDEVQAMVSLVLRMERARVAALMPEGVEDALRAYLTEADRELRGEPSDTLRERFIALERAIASAALSAERERLASLTPEEVVEAAAKAMWAYNLRDIPGATAVGTPESREAQVGMWRDAARAALPLLLAPEVAKREAVERELVHLRRMLDSAEKEVAHFRNALESIAQGGGHSGDVAQEALAGGEK